MDKLTDEGQATNEILQADEISALASIFDKDWIMEDEAEKVYSIKISNASEESVYLQVIFPETYPLECPPTYRISAPWMSRSCKNRLCSEIEDIYCQNAGESIIFLWIEKIKSFIEDDDVQTEYCTDEDLLAEAEVMNTELFENLCIVDKSENNAKFEGSELPEIYHGEPILDRKSVFQGHVAKVVTQDQVNQVMSKLNENRKIATATHNMFAYRIARENHNAFIQDCEDDGETRAGSVLLRLLQMLGMCDVLVVVSRWYGGIHLGPDRFKHISNAARTVLLSSGFLVEKTQSFTKKSKKR